MPNIDTTSPRSDFEKMTDNLALLLLILLFAITAYNYIYLPETIPTHFNFKGQADAWGSKITLWIMPLAGLLLFFLLSLAQKFPRLYNYPVKITEENAQKQYLLARTLLRELKAAVLFLFLVIQWNIFSMLKDPTAQFGIVFYLILIFIVFAPIVFYFYQAIKFK